ncbi:MAG: glycosyltransferase [Bacteroidetes bacterium]|nr:glycosyltransferase [Bacteroidota bacterium]MBS1608623.1 glycosyltransferase [Bacteroidota bacterium]
MKILFFIEAMRSGGKERRLVELMKGLKAIPDLRFEVVVMDNDVHYKDIFKLGINIHFLLRTTKKDISAFYKFYKICKEYKPDIVHCWDSMTSIYSIPACKLLKIKLVNGAIVDAPSERHIFNKHWLRAKIAFPFSNLIVGNSNTGLAAYNAPKKKSVCIHNGFNFERIKTVRENKITRENLKVSTSFVVGMVASFSETKDYKTYFAAAQKLLEKRNDITFLAIGSDTDSNDARKMIQDKYVANFKLLGKRSDIESLIDLMDICILATFTEGISNAILEYMALGKPVIASSGGGTPEIVDDNVTGFLIETSSPGQLCDKMELLLKDKKLRIEMGKAGNNRIHNHFSIDKMVGEYVVNYESLTGQS